MVANRDLNHLKKIYSFSSTVVDYCEELIEMKKKIFADRLLKSTMSATESLHAATKQKHAYTCIPHLKKAEKEINIIVNLIKISHSTQSFTESYRQKIVLEGEQLRDLCSKKLREL